MHALSFFGLALAFVSPVWHSDYDTASILAIQEKKDLIIHFRGDDFLDEVLSHEEVRRRLGEYVCLRLPLDYQVRGETLLQHAAFADMMGSQGLAALSYRDKNLPVHGQVISMHPIVRSHYGWVPRYGVDEVNVILGLPAHATITQRSMMYAIHVHPERPQSIRAHCHPAFLEHCRAHSARQAHLRRQHHADIIAASSRLGGEVGEALGNASEVVAESWGTVVGGETVLEAAFSCVDAWRHSSGHWGAVSRLHRYFGYDIAKGANGTWYATGIFSD